MSLIEINKVQFGYTNQINILKNISVKIEENEFICIVGENGSGKSTLLKCILGLNKVTKGTIKLDEKAGYLPQISSIQENFPATVEEIILSGTLPNNLMKIWYSKEDKKIAKTIMEDLKLYDIRKTNFSELSGGQKQRVLIARALCSTNKLMILDEPVNGLDPKIANQIYKLIQKLNKEKGITILMVSHDIERALSYCSRVIELKNGKITFDGVPSEYKNGGIK